MLFCYYTGGLHFLWYLSWGSSVTEMCIHLSIYYYIRKGNHCSIVCCSKCSWCGINSLKVLELIYNMIWWLFTKKSKGTISSIFWSLICLDAHKCKQHKPETSSINVKWLYSITLWPMQFKGSRIWREGRKNKHLIPISFSFTVITTKIKCIGKLTSNIGMHDEESNNLQ